MNSEATELLSIATAYLQEEVAPQANQLDRDVNALRLALRGLGDRSLLALKVPSNLGGSGLAAIDYGRWCIAIARASGALAFLQTQHQSAASFLAKSNNKALQAKYLSHLATGEVLIGVGFSHLRRRGKPMVLAQPVPEGYLVTGTVPWITGFNYFHHFILGASLADGSEIYALLPLHETYQATGGQIRFSQPMELIAMTATNTVSATLDNWLLKQKNILTINPPGSIQLTSQQNVLHHGFYALGCAKAGLDVLQAIGSKKQLDFIVTSWQALQAEVNDCVSNVFASMSDENTNYQEQLRLRTWAINLAGRCSQAAVIAASGSANSVHSPAGRVYREALLFSVSGQTTDVMQSSLQELKTVNNLSCKQSQPFCEW